MQTQLITIHQNTLTSFHLFGTDLKKRKGKKRLVCKFNITKIEK